MNLFHHWFASGCIYSSEETTYALACLASGIKIRGTERDTHMEFSCVDESNRRVSHSYA